MVDNPPASAGGIRGIGSIPGSGRIPWKRKWLLTAVFLLEESHEQRSLAGYGPSAHKELNTAWGRAGELSLHLVSEVEPRQRRQSHEPL